MKKFNLGEFIWFVFIFILEYLIIKMTMNEKMFLIVSRDMKIYIILALIILSLILVVQFFNIFKPSTRKNFKGGYFVFIFALITLNIAMNLDLREISLDLKGVQLYHYGHKEKDSHNHFLEEEKEREALVFTEENFHGLLEELIINLDEFLGKEISMEGLFYLDSQYEEDEFAITQIDMTCCIVDSMYLGVMCRGDVPKVKNGSEIKVKGIIEEKEVENLKGEKIRVPLINVFYTDTLQ